MKRTIAIYHPNMDYANTLLKKFRIALPNHNIILWKKDKPIDYLITWIVNKDMVSTPKLQVIFGLVAGVDSFISVKLPDNLQIVRLEEAGMGSQMLEISLYAILHYSRDMISLRRGQEQKRWLPIATPKRIPFSTKIGVMGLGQLGGFVANALVKLGYPVSGYSSSPKNIDGIQCFAKNELNEFLHNSEVLINLLPLTSATENILDKDLFGHLPRGSYLINIARGKHLVEKDLIPALDSGQLSGALLDVFRIEPLPKEHPFWTDDRIIITPHLAAITLQKEAVKQISSNIIAFENNHPMTGVVDKDRGY